MSEKREMDSAKADDAKAPSSMNMNLIWIGVAVVFFAALANRNGASDESSSNDSAPTGHISTSSCVSKVHGLTQYDHSRLKLVGQTPSSVNISYRNDFGRVHKFRCIGQSGTVQLFAEGAGMWMDM